jgi:hypothetical protein
MDFRKAIVSSAVACALGFGVTVASAQMTTTTEKTTTYSGTVSEVNPSASTIILRSESSSAPQTYTYNKETIFTDDTGKVVSYDAIKNSPVTIQYTRDGDRMIVTKVVKQPTTVERKTTTTTTTGN